MSYSDRPHGYEPDFWFKYLSNIFIDVEYTDEGPDIYLNERYTTFKIGNYRDKSNPEWGVDFIYFKLGDENVNNEIHFVLPYLLLVKPSTEEDYKKYFASGSLFRHYLYFAPKIADLVVPHIKRHFPQFVKK